MFLLNREGLQSVGSELEDQQKLYFQTQTAAELEKNNTDDEIADILRLRSKLRQEEESKSEQVGFLRDEVDFMSPKIKRSEELLSEVVNQVSLLKEKDENASRMIEEALSEQEPLHSRIEELNEDKQRTLQRVRIAENQLNKLDANYSALVSKRDFSRDSFDRSMEEQCEGIIEPSTLFYGDEFSIEIENVSPNKAGFFTKKGLTDGLRSGFRFLAYDKFLGERAVPFFIRCTLVEPNYSFMQVDGDPLAVSSDLLISGQKLFLIRTGDSSNELDDDQLNEFDI